MLVAAGVLGFDVALVRPSFSSGDRSGRYRVAASDFLQPRLESLGFAPRAVSSLRGTRRASAGSSVTAASPPSFRPRRHGVRMERHGKVKSNTRPKRSQSFPRTHPSRVAPGGVSSGVTDAPAKQLACHRVGSPRRCSAENADTWLNKACHSSPTEITIQGRAGTSVSRRAAKPTDPVLTGTAPSAHRRTRERSPRPRLERLPRPCLSSPSSSDRRARPWRRP